MNIPLIFTKLQKRLKSTSLQDRKEKFFNSKFSNKNERNLPCRGIARFRKDREESSSGCEPCTGSITASALVSPRSQCVDKSNFVTVLVIAITSQLFAIARGPADLSTAINIDAPREIGRRSGRVSCCEDARALCASR